MLTLQVNINEIPDYKILLTDTTGFITGSNTTGFLPESATATDTNFKLSEVGIITVSVWNAISGSTLDAKNTIVKTSSQIIAVTDYINNYNNVIPSQSIILTKDGSYTIYYVVIPLKTKLDTTPSLIGTESHVYCLNSDNKIIEYSKPTVIVDELTLVSNLDSSNLKSIYYSKTLFSINYLTSCYMSYLYSLGFFECPDPCKGDPGLKDNKNLVSDAITVVNYYLEICDTISAQQLIESIMGCNDLCTYPTIDIGGASCCQS